MTESYISDHYSDSHNGSEKSLSAAELLQNTIRYSFDRDEDWQIASDFFPQYKEKFAQLRTIIARRRQLAEPEALVASGQGKVGQIVLESRFYHIALNSILINRLYPVGTLPDIDETQKARIATEVEAMRNEAGDSIDDDFKVREALASILEGRLRTGPLVPSLDLQLVLLQP